jgi:prophage regulatory protein
VSLPNEHDDALLTAREVARRYGVHEKTAWRWAREGRIPKPVAPFNKWRLSDVIAHLKSLDFAEMKELAS